MSEPSVEYLIGDLLRQSGQKLAVAESCTGGLISDRITNVPGSSDYFIAGVVSYANQAKVNLLQVRRATLESVGAVSRQTVIEMARGVRQVNSVEIGVSVSGIAGPGGGTGDKPVGTTWIGLSSTDYENAWRYLFQGSRREVKEQAAQMALQVLYNYLVGQYRTGKSNGPG